MHIALFTPSWPAGSMASGIVTYVDAMRTELLAQGHRVSLVSPAGHVASSSTHRGWIGRASRFLGTINSRIQPRPRSAFDIGKTIAGTINRIHALDPIDVIEMEESFGWVGEVLMRCPPPVVCKLHGPAFLTMVTEELDTPFGREKVRREGEALDRLPVLVAPSRYTLAETMTRYALTPQTAKHVVNPLPAPADLTLWNVDTFERDTVLFVGRFDKIKGGDIAVLAFQRLLERRPRSRLVVVGPDPGLLLPSGQIQHFDEYVASLRDPTLSSAISWQGIVTPVSLRQIRPRAAVTLVPSRRESQGYTALEAMLQACPIVCTDTSGLAENVVHGVTGLKARADDPQDLATQMQRLLEDPLTARSLGTAGREYVVKHHNPSMVVAQMIEVYREAIALRRRDNRR